MGAGLRPGAKAPEQPPDPNAGAPVLDSTLTLFFRRKIRKQIVTGVDRIPGAACSASRANPTILRNRTIPAIPSFVAGLRYPGGSVSTIS